MIEFIQQNEQQARMGFFLGTLLIMGLLEAIFPKKERVDTRIRRWISNLGIVVIGSLLVRMSTLILPVVVAEVAYKNGWGLLNLVSLRTWASIAIAIIILDFIIYLQHVVFHFLPTLWKLHIVHHSDVDLDVTSGNRFHPFEIFISIGVKLAAILLIGPLPIAVILFEIILNGMAQFNHANVKLPRFLDSFLRVLLVTPDVHRVHHSVLLNETNSNFGFNLCIWDRIFGTYRAQPEKGHDEMIIGVPEHPNPEKLTLIRLLALPFLKGRSSS